MNILKALRFPLTHFKIYTYGKKEPCRRVIILATGFIFYLCFIFEMYNVWLDGANIDQLFATPFHLLLMLCLKDFNFLLCIIKFDVRVNVECDANIAVPHQILQGFSTEAAQGHISAIRMPANVRRYLRELVPIDFVIFCNCRLEPMFPVHCNYWFPVKVIIKKVGITINDLLYLRGRSFPQEF